MISSVAQSTFLPGVVTLRSGDLSENPSTRRSRSRSLFSNLRTRPTKKIAIVPFASILLNRPVQHRRVSLYIDTESKLYPCMSPMMER